MIDTADKGYYVERGQRINRHLEAMEEAAKNFSIKNFKKCDAFQLAVIDRAATLINLKKEGKQQELKKVLE